MSNETVNNSEILFIYEVDGANPNGDPDNGNRPRMDSNEYVEVTDLRLKRFIRDYIDQCVDGVNVVVKSGVMIEVTKKGKTEKSKASTMAHLIESAITNYNKNNETKKIDSSDKFLEAFKDIAYFGIVTGDPKDYKIFLESNYYGAIQFQYGKTFNKPVIKEHAISPVAETLGEDHRVEYAVVGFNGAVNGKTAIKNKLIPKDIQNFDEYVIKSLPTISRQSRSKIGHQSLLYLRIEYNGNLKGMHKSKNLQRLVTLKNNDISKLSDCEFDFTKLFNYLEDREEDIASIHYYAIDEFPKVQLESESVSFVDKIKNFFNDKAKTVLGEEKK